MGLKLVAKMSSLRPVSKDFSLLDQGKIVIDFTICFLAWLGNLLLPWTPSMDRVHGPLSWTGSLDPLFLPPLKLLNNIGTQGVQELFFVNKKRLEVANGAYQSIVKP